MSQETILRQMQERRKQAEQDASRARREVMKQIPAFQKIESQIADRVSRYAIEQIQSSKSEKQKKNAELKFERDLRTLKEKRARILADHGLSDGSFLPRYECSKCKDTGYVGQEICFCLKQKRIESLRKSYHLSHMLAKENFETFNPHHFSTERTIKTPEGKWISQSESMLERKKTAERFCELFPHGKSMILFGGTGLGKTFLCNCIAKAIIEKGHTVVYHSAVQLNRLFKENSSFDRSKEVEAAHRSLFEADLLIIDDLGAERATEFTVSELYDIIDTRLITEKSTILSANLSVSDIREIYGDRIYSRFQKYIWLKFYGKDTREQ
ncbi:MAG: ATP-binding protein [Bacillota bacterium]|nr:ATP-binding protein [Bacillota bacterium]